jgi:hypothetical protein
MILLLYVTHLVKMGEIAHLGGAGCHVMGQCENLPVQSQEYPPDPSSSSPIVQRKFLDFPDPLLSAMG